MCSMASSKKWCSSSMSFLLLLLLLLLFGSVFSNVDRFNPSCMPDPPITPIPVFPLDVDLLQFALNLEFLEAEFFLIASTGQWLDYYAPNLANGGPPPIGGTRANLDPLTRRTIEEFGYQEIDHLRAIETTVGGIPRPLIDLSARNFAHIFDQAWGYPLNPPFDPYSNSLNYLLASYVIPYMGLVGYVGANPNTNGFIAKRVLAGLLAVEAGQDAVIRDRLYQRAEEIVPPYNHTVAEFTERISTLRNRLAGCGIKDEGITVPKWLGAENRTSSNVLSADANSLGYSRNAREILRVVYGTGDEHRPGGFYPRGGNGRIARQSLLDD